MERFLRAKLVHGDFREVSAQRSKIMAAIRSKGNKSTELRLKMALVRQGISGWKSHPQDIPGKPDFFFPKELFAVFVDGCFWHGCRKCGHIPKTNQAFWAAKIARNQARHRKVGRLLKKRGIRTLRFWEHQLRADPQKCVNRLLQALN